MAIILGLPAAYLVILLLLWAFPGANAFSQT